MRRRPPHHPLRSLLMMCRRFRIVLPLLAIFIMLLPPLSDAHFRLTFPEGRFPPFDFLDSQRTVGPCGVPKCIRSPTTHFQTERTYHISWRMSMEHKGRFRMRLLNSNNTALENWILWPDGRVLDTTKFFDSTNAQTVQVRFPFSCPNCTLLLEKEITELNNTITEMGCAEVNIMPEGDNDYGDPCSGNGRYHAEHQICRCDGGYSGEHCQYKDDCVEDTDCGPLGRCLADAIHRKQKSCFCQFGHFGTNCEKRSIPDDQQGCFSHSGPDNSSRVAHWFRDGYGLFNPNCYSLKNLTDGDSDKLYWRLVGDSLEIVLDFHTNSWVALGWRPLNIPPACRLFPQVHAVDGRDSDISKTSGFKIGVLEWPLHPMDCTDMVMASVRDGTHLHIADMYSRDRSSPLRDTVLDGEESMSAAYGLEKDGRMVVVFRRMVPEIEPTDHPLGPGEISLIWAKGQPMKKRDPGFYSDGQWKYHGNETTARGHLKLEFVSAAQMEELRGPLVHLDNGGSIRPGKHRISGGADAAGGGGIKKLGSSSARGTHPTVSPADEPPPTLLPPADKTDMVPKTTKSDGSNGTTTDQMEEAPISGPDLQAIVALLTSSDNRIVALPEEASNSTDSGKNNGTTTMLLHQQHQEEEEVSHPHQSSAAKKGSSQNNATTHRQNKGNKAVVSKQQNNEAANSSNKVHSKQQTLHSAEPGGHHHQQQNKQLPPGRTVQQGGTADDSNKVAELEEEANNLLRKQQGESPSTKTRHEGGDTGQGKLEDNTVLRRAPSTGSAARGSTTPAATVLLALAIVVVLLQLLFFC